MYKQSFSEIEAINIALYREKQALDADCCKCDPDQVEVFGCECGYEEVQEVNF